MLHSRLMKRTAVSDNRRVGTLLPLGLLAVLGVALATRPAATGPLEDLAARQLVGNVYHWPEGDAWDRETTHGVNVSPYNRAMAFNEAIDGVVEATSASYQWDTWNKYGTSYSIPSGVDENSATASDFTGLLYALETQFDTITVHMGRTYSDGGGWGVVPNLYLYRPAGVGVNAYNDPNITRPEAAAGVAAGWVQVPVAAYGVPPAPGEASLDADPADFDMNSNTTRPPSVTFDLGALSAAERSATGWAVGGTPGNMSGHFVSWSELQATGTTLVNGLPTSPGDIVRLTPGKVVANSYDNVYNITGVARDDAFTILTNRGSTTQLGNANTANSGIDTNSSSATSDFVGLTYNSEQKFDFLSVDLGRQFDDGGSWASRPKVYVLQNNVDTNNTPPESDPGNWTEVVSADLVSQVGFGATTPNETDNTLVFDLRRAAADRRTGYGWAVGGVAGNGGLGGAPSNDYISVNELQAFSDTRQTPDGTTWSSYNAVIRDDGTDPSRTDAVGEVRADIMGSDGTTNAQLRVYETQLGVFDPGFDISQSAGSLSYYDPMPSAIAQEYVQDSGWANGPLSGYYYYMGKSAIPRGDDNKSSYPLGPRKDEAAGPLPPTLPGAPAEIYDLQTHPNRDGDQLIVTAFIVPEDGTYEILNFAARRWSEAGSGNSYQSSYRIYGPDGLWLGNPASIHFQGAGAAHILTDGTNDSQWQIDSSRYVLKSLAAGDEIYFAHHDNTFTASGPWYYDGTEITFDIRLIPEPSTWLLACLGLVCLVVYVRRRLG